MMKYFKNVKDEKELKKAYFKFVKQFHTDNGGNKEDFIEMKAEYEKIIKENLYSKTQEEEETNNEENMKKFADVIDKIVILEGLEIEIIGEWIWVGGNSYLHKDILKENKFFFSRGKKKWYWNGDDKKSKRRSHMSYEEIKEKYGYTKVKNKKVKLLGC